MSYFKTAQDLYNVLGLFMKEMNGGDPAVVAKLSELGKVIRYSYTEPEAQITFFADKDKEFQYDMGETNLVPDITMSMKGDIGHEYYQGKVNLVAAMTRGQIKSKGPIQPLLKLTPLAKKAIDAYPSWLKEHSFDNLQK